MNDRTDRIKGRSAHGGVLLVPCQINGLHRYWFLADTGAAQTVIRPQVAEEVGVDKARPLRHQQISSVHQDREGAGRLSGADPGGISFCAWG